MNAIVIFAGFKAERPGEAEVPGWSSGVFDPDRPGGLSHFYDSMSFGRLTVRGEVASQWYESDHEAEYYLSDDPSEPGNFGQFSSEILATADADVDFARFDNDGPDGVPNSGDDDGFVDLVIIVTPRLPKGFLFGPATGTANLGLAEPYETADPGAGGEAVAIETGLIAQGTSFAETVGTVAHEMGHLLALPDLFNTLFLASPEPRDPADDSAGIGRWGLMGWGALGWNGDDGPVSFSAWSRLRLGWAQVQDIQRVSERVLLRSVGETGHVYRVPIGVGEYYLLEYRNREGSHYDRSIPAEGLLIWHVRFDPPKWRVELVSADGLWRGAGYPLGQTADPLSGGDNLDFWAHDAEYAERHGGNLGDATDVFGQNGYDRFTSLTNPAATNHAGSRSISVTEIEVTPEGAWVRVEVDPPRLDFGEVTVVDETDDGVLVAGEEAWLSFDPVNRGGLAARGVTFTVETSDTAVTTTSAAGAILDLGIDERLFGGVASRGGGPRLRVEPSLVGSHRVVLEMVATAGDVEIGRKRLEIPVVGARQRVLSAVVEDGDGDGEIDPGDFFHVVIRLAMDDAPALLPGVVFDLSSLGDGVEQIGTGRVFFGDEAPGVVAMQSSPEFLASVEAAGRPQSFVLVARTAFESWADTIEFGVTSRPDRTPPRITLVRTRASAGGLRIQVADRWVLEGGDVRDLVGQVYSAQDTQVVASVPLHLKDGVYEGTWDGPEGRYLVAVSATDETGNRGETKLLPTAIVGGIVGAFDEGSAADWTSLNLPAETTTGQFARIQVAENGTTWYGATQARLWRSDDAGESWHPTGLMFQGHSLRATIHIDAEDPATVYVAEEAFLSTSRNIHQSLGHVLVSHDGGFSWARVALPEGVTSVHVDAGLPGRLYSAEEGELFLSENEGVSWRVLQTEGTVINLMTHPADVAATYVTVWDGERSSLWKLTDSGLDFKAHITGSQTFPVPDPWQKGGFYRAAADSTIEHSTDEGVSWSPLARMGGWVSGIAVSAVERGLLYASVDSRLLRSLDGGLSWAELDGIYNQLRIRVVPALPSVLLLEKSSGFSTEFRVSHDYGETSVTLGVDEKSAPAGALWFDAAARLNVASLRRDEEGQSVRGIRRLTAGGLEWLWTGNAGGFSFVDAPFDVLFQDPLSENVLLAHPANGVNSYMRSVDGGETWARATEGTFGITFRLAALPKIVGDPLRHGTYYMTDEFIRRTDDFGETWARIGPLEDARLFDPTRAAGLLLGPDPGVLITAYRDSVWQSEDDGATWHVIGRVEPGEVTLDLVRHRAEPERLFALTLRGCFVSNDGGHRWGKAMSPLSGFWMSAHFRQDPEDDDVLYIVSNRELHRTTDAGATWTSLEDQLPGMPWIHDLAIDPLDPSSVYLATTAGVFRLGNAASPTAVVAEAAALPRDPLLRQNYPNPFNPSTVIEYLLPEAVEVQLEIYALTGQRVRVLVSEEQPAGRYRSVWHGRNSEGHAVASGVYFSRLRAGRLTRVTKMLLIR